jgi:hypothetical protein
LGSCAGPGGAGGSVRRGEDDAYPFGGATPPTPGPETIVRLCRGEADAGTLRLEALDAIRRAVAFDA